MISGTMVETRDTIGSCATSYRLTWHPAHDVAQHESTQADLSTHKLAREAWQAGHDALQAGHDALQAASGVLRGEAPEAQATPADSEGWEPPPPGRWEIVPEHSTVEFVARHLMVSKVRGTFSRFAGVIDTGPGPDDASVKAWVEAGSLQTGDPARDEHLRSDAFFHAERWPRLLLAGKVEQANVNRYLLRADLTIRGVTNAVDFDVLASRPRHGAGSGTDEVLALLATARVNRKDFGLKWNAVIETGGVVVADEVDLRLEVVARLSTPR